MKNLNEQDKMAQAKFEILLAQESIKALLEEFGETGAVISMRLPDEDRIYAEMIAPYLLTIYLKRLEIENIKNGHNPALEELMFNVSDDVEELINAKAKLLIIKRKKENTLKTIFNRYGRIRFKGNEPLKIEAQQVVKVITEEENQRALIKSLEEKIKNQN